MIMIIIIITIQYTATYINSQNRQRHSTPWKAGGSEYEELVIASISELRIM